jgi:hypothetical protein
MLHSLATCAAYLHTNEGKLGIMEPSVQPSDNTARSELHFITKLLGRGPFLLVSARPESASNRVKRVA